MLYVTVTAIKAHPTSTVAPNTQQKLSGYKKQELLLELAPVQGRLTNDSLLKQSR